MGLSKAREKAESSHPSRCVILTHIEGSKKDIRPSKISISASEPTPVPTGTLLRRWKSGVGKPDLGFATMAPRRKRRTNLGASDIADELILDPISQVGEQLRPDGETYRTRTSVFPLVMIYQRIHLP